MSQGDTPTSIANRAIFQIGDDQPPITGTLPNFDNSTAGIAAAQLYTATVRTVARSFGWDFSRNVAALALTGNAAPLNYAYEYVYPANGIEIRQVVPPAFADSNNPLPVRWDVGNVLVAGVPTKVIWTNLENANATITGQPPEALWDAGFTEAVVRLLASEFAMAIGGRQDTSKAMLESAGDFERVAETRNG